MEKGGEGIWRGREYPALLRISKWLDYNITDLDCKADRENFEAIEGGRGQQIRDHTKALGFFPSCFHLCTQIL